MGRVRGAPVRAEPGGWVDPDRERLPGIYYRSQLHGWAGLLVAIISQAQADARAGMDDAVWWLEYQQIPLAERPSPWQRKAQPAGDD